VDLPPRQSDSALTAQGPVTLAVLLIGLGIGVVTLEQGVLVGKMVVGGGVFVLLVAGVSLTIENSKSIARVRKVTSFLPVPWIENRLTWVDRWISLSAFAFVAVSFGMAGLYSINLARVGACDDWSISWPWGAA
jgi:hypothetical protein